MSYATAYHDPQAATDAYSQDVQMTANSPASEATYNLTASTFIKDDKDDGRSSMAPTTVMLATAIIVFVLASGTIMLLALGFGFGSNDQKTETHQHDEVAEDNLGDVRDNSMIVPEFRISTALTTRSGVEGSTSHSTAAPAFPAEETIMETTLTPPTLSTVPLKKIKWQRLLCTIGTKLNTSKMFPDDGFCDYMFYDSVYKRGPTTFEPNNVEAALSIFLGVRPNMDDTKFGIGFSYKYRRELKLQLSANGGAPPLMLQYFWDRNICDFGILDTPTNGLDETSLEEMLESLKMLHDFSISQRPQGESCVVVFAGPAADTRMENIYFEKFSKIFTPDIVVILSHYGQGDNTLQDCHVMPPTVLTRPPALGTSHGYKEDLLTAADIISRLTARGVNASWALSVTMKGRWTVLKAGQPPNFLSLCEHDPGAESFGSYTNVCNDTDFDHDFYYNSTVYGSLVRSLSNGQMFSFDNETTLKEKRKWFAEQYMPTPMNEEHEAMTQAKMADTLFSVVVQPALHNRMSMLCRVKEQYLSLSFGIAAFDVDYDYNLEICSLTYYLWPFPRVWTLKDLAKHFEKIFEQPLVIDYCVSLEDYY